VEPGAVHVVLPAALRRTDRGLWRRPRPIGTRTERPLRRTRRSGPGWVLLPRSVRSIRRAVGARSPIRCAREPPAVQVRSSGSHGPSSAATDVLERHSVCPSRRSRRVWVSSRWSEPGLQGLRRRDSLAVLVEDDPTGDNGESRCGNHLTLQFEQVASGQTSRSFPRPSVAAPRAFPRTPTARRVSGGGPPPQLPQVSGQPRRPDPSSQRQPPFPLPLPLASAVAVAVPAVVVWGCLVGRLCVVVCAVEVGGGWRRWLRGRRLPDGGLDRD
jgi:hypothetical protein